jgi:hypothetical protein
VSNGAGPHIYVGVIRLGPLRRGLIRFDLQPIPVGSTIESADMVLNLSANGVVGPAEVRVHRLLGSFGEGASNSGSPGGMGAPATAGDATWAHRFFPDEMWLSQGGDFITSPSSATTPMNTGSITFASLAADLQAWVDGAAPNNGWLLKTDELVTQTSMRFDSRENLDGGVQPKLVATFRAGGDTNGDDLVDIGDFATLAANFNLPLSGPNNGDFNRDGIVDIGDFAVLAANFNLDFGRSAVPEPGMLGTLAVPLLISLRHRSKRR